MYQYILYFIVKRKKERSATRHPCPTPKTKKGGSLVCLSAVQQARGSLGTSLYFTPYAPYWFGVTTVLYVYIPTHTQYDGL